jgi:hypothetical protein
MAKLIDLDRRFFEVPATDTRLNPGAMLPADIALHGSQDWQGILVHRYLVVLGEAGTGKTSEFRQRAAMLSTAGMAAFYVEVRRVAEGGLTKALALEAVEQLDAWRLSGSEATLFLDSVDEAKLQRRSLADALRALRSELKEEWGRVRLVISCRVSDWQAIGDRDQLAEAIPKSRSGTKGSDEPAEAVHVVQIAPLNDIQVRKLAAAHSIRDVDGFVAAIKAKSAHAFVERPLDVQWIGAYWKEHGRIGSLRELIEENIRQKLKEQGARRSNLSPAMAQDGARLLAGYAVLRRHEAFRLPNETEEVDAGSAAIDPTDVLPNWSRDDVLELLGRPIFDESTYGRVRFHHRSVQEFLAASWLRGLVEAGLPYYRLRDLLIRQEGAERVVPDYLGAVTAWLCLWVKQLRMEVIREAPALLIAFGDPSGLTPAERGAAIRSYAATYGKRERLFDDFEIASLDRFASVELGDVIHALLSDVDHPAELRVTLLEIVERGRIERCIPVALGNALDRQASSRVRLAAIRAVAAAGSLGQRQSLLTLVTTEEAWDHDVAGAFVGSLYPDLLDSAGLLTVLGSAKPVPDSFLTLLKSAVEGDVPRRGDETQRLSLLEQLLEFVCPRGPDGTRAMFPGRQWLERSLGSLCAAVLDDLPRSAATTPPPALRDALGWFQERQGSGRDIWSGVEAVREAVARNDLIRRDIFWRRVDAHRAEIGKFPVRVHELKFRHDLFEFSESDLDWLAADAKSKADVRERLLAFDAMQWMPLPAERRDRVFALMGTIAASDEALRARLGRILARVPGEHPETVKFAREQRAREIRSARRDQEDRSALLAEIGSIRLGTNQNALLFLLQRAQEKDTRNRWSSISVEPLRERYGDEVAQAALEGWRAYWRTCDPQLPYEREQRNSVPWTVVLGLAGLSADFESGLSPASLSDDQAAKACRLAASELNGFPAWLTRLAEAKGEVVATALEPALSADYHSSTVVHDVLDKLPRADEPVRRACIAVVERLVADSDPLTIEALEGALATLLSLPETPKPGLQGVIAARCRASQVDQRWTALWWYALACVQSDAAMDCLEQLLGARQPDAAYELIESICDRIYDGLLGANFALRHSVGALGRMIPLVYEHIKVERDIWHDGVFHPGARDHAQEVRGSLVSWLAAIPGEPSVAELRRIAEDPRCARARDWLLRKADERLLDNASRREPTVVAYLLHMIRAHGTRASDHVAETKQAITRVRILFLAFNPITRNQLALPEEVRAINLALTAAELRDTISFEVRWAVRVGDLQQSLLDERPTIVHFSGHGDGPSGLALHGEVEGDEQMLSTEALTRLLGDFKDTVRLVVLNTCFSEIQAKAAVQHIDFAVGMNRSIDDRAARLYSTALYQAIGYGESIEGAHEFGITAIAMDGMAKEAKKPVLLARPGVDPAEVVLTEGK